MIDVRAIWSSLRQAPRELRYSLELAERYMNVAKLDAGTGRGRRAGGGANPQSGLHGPAGDGVIYTLPVHSAAHIRTDRRETETLAG